MDHRLAFATDIHWNFADPDAKSRFFAQLAELSADALLITGDIAEAPSLAASLAEIHHVSDLPLYWVAGNHDYYGSSVVYLRAEIAPRCAGVYLTACDAPIEFDGYTLVGVDGWYDVRRGMAERSPVMLTDFGRIPDLLTPHAARVRKLRALADADALQLRAQLAATDTRPVVVATHVPPYANASWYEGRMSGPEYQPYFTSQATSDVLDATSREMLVACGHTHHFRDYQHAPNVRVVVGAAEYCEPQVQGVIVGGRTFETAGIIAVRKSVARAREQEAAGRPFQRLGLSALAPDDD